MIVNYNSLRSGRDTWLRTGIGDVVGSPPISSLKTTRPSWLVLLLLFLCLTVGQMANAQTYFSESFESPTWYLNGDGVTAATNAGPNAPSGWKQTRVVNNVAPSACATSGGHDWGQSTWSTGTTWLSSANYPTGCTPYGGSPTAPPDGTKALWFYDGWTSSGNTRRIESPAVDLSTATNPIISFSYSYAGSGASTFVGSLDGGTTWNTLGTVASTSSGVWVTKIINIPAAYKISTAKFGFQIASTFGSFDVFLDNVVVREGTVPNAAPITFTSTVVTATSMTINWVDNSTNETGFRVYRSTDNVNFVQVGSDITSTSVATTGTAYNSAQTALTPGTTYFYRIVSYREVESSNLTGSQATTAGTTYYWVGAAAGADFNTAANWNTNAAGGGSVRTTPLATDVLILDGAGTTAGAASIVTLAGAGTCGQLLITNNTAVTIQSTSTTLRTITINGGPGSDLDVPSGSTLNLTNANPAAIAFSGTGNTGNIAGIYNAAVNTSNVITTTGGTGTLVTVASTGVVNNSIPGASGGFSASTATLSFAAGSNYNVSGATTGAPNLPLATWDTTSNILITGITTSTTAPTNNVQSFGNLTYNCPTATSASTMSFFTTSTTAVIKGNLNIVSTGAGIFRALTSGTLTVNGNVNVTGGILQSASSTGTLIASGNTTISSGATLDMLAGTYSQRGNTFTNNGIITGTGGTLGFLNFTGSAAQTLAGTGSVTANLAVISMQNTAGLTITHSAQIPTLRVNLFQGSITGSDKITIGTGAAAAATVQIGSAGLTTPGGSFVAMPTFNLGTGTYSLLYAQESVARTTGTEVPATRAVTAITHSNSNGLTISGGNLSTGTLTFSALSGGNIVTNGSNVLTVTGTATTSIVRTLATAYVNGPLQITLPASLATGSTYTLPIGKGTLNPFALVNPTTNAGGTVTVRAEVFDASSGGTPSGTIGLLKTNRYWAASITAGAANFTNSLIQLNDAPAGADAIAESSTVNGAYTLTGGVTSTVTASSITSTAPASTTLPGFYVMANKAAATLSGLAISPTGNQCTNVARTVTVNVTPGGAAVTSVAISYQVNGGTVQNVAMTNTTGLGGFNTDTWSGVIPTVTPSNGTVTWSVTATDGNSLTRTQAGTTYTDEPLTGLTASGSASLSTICNGSSTVLTATLSSATTATGYVAPTAVTNATTDEDLGNVTITKGATTILNNTSAINTLVGTIGTATGTAGSYSNFTSFGPYALNAGDTYNFSLSSLQQTTAYSNSMAIYIDYNGNGSFADAGEAVYVAGATTAGAHTETGSFTVPSSAKTGITRMRVISNEGLITSPTMAVSYGEFEEYAISIKAAPSTVTWSDGTNTFSGNNITVTPTASATYTPTVTYLGCSTVGNSANVTVLPLPIAPTTTPGSHCGPGSVSLAASTTESGTTIKWYATSSSNTVLFTGSPYNTPSLSATTTYYVAADNGTCQSSRVAVAATINTPPTFAISSNGTTATTSTSTCNGGTSATFTALGTDYDTFTISPNTGIASSNLSGAFSASFNPTATTVYTINASQSSGALCTASLTFTVTVNSSNVTVASSSNTICKGSPVTLSASSVALVSGPQTSPTGYAASNATNTLDEEILSVSFGSLTNSSTCTTTGGAGSILNEYSNYTALPAPTVTAGTTVPITVQIGTCNSVFSNFTNVYIDYNRNGSFETSELAFSSTGSPSGAHTDSGNIVIPTTAAPGVTRMRVFNTEFGSASSSPNVTYGYGETEDYNVNIISSAPATSTYTYAWTSTPAGFTANTATTTATPLVTTTYNVAATAPNGCTSNGSVTVTVNTDAIADITGGANSICLGSPTVPSVVDFDSTVGAIWTSSNTSVATVDANGVVTPLAVGTTVINARIDNPTTGCTTYAANPQTVNVYSPLLITSSPQALSILDYDGTNTTTHTFNVTASGSITGYQWQVSPTGVEGSFSNLANSAPYSGVTTNTLTLTNATTAINGFYYRALVTGNSPCSSPIASDAALLTVSDVSITADPVFGAPICGSGDRNVTVGVSGPTGTTVVWQYSDDNGGSWNTIDGSSVGALSFTGDVSSTTLELHNITSANNGWLLRAAAVSGDTAVFSNPTTIVVNQSAIVNTGAPVQNATVCSTSGGTAVFTVSATGATAYQWQYSHDGSSWAGVANGTPSGATYSNGSTPSLTVNVSNAIVAGPHYYRAMVSSQPGCPAQYSNVAELIINTPVVTVSPSTAFICNPGGSPVTLTANGTAATYSWSPAAGLSSTSGASVTASPTVTTTYTVTGTEAGGCSKTAQVTVSVGTAVSATATATPASLCPGSNSQLQAVLSATNSGVAAYAFGATAGTYTPLSGGTSSTALGDDGTQVGIPIGFNFNYLGTTNSTFSISTNGTIRLATTGTSYTNSLATVTNVIAPFWDDNNLSAGSIKYLTTGVAPNRVLTVDWSNISIGGSGSTSNSTSSFQVQLFETTNAIKFIYGNLNTTNGVTASIGISGNTAGQLKSVTPLSPVGSSTVSSTENAAISSAANIPSGTTYTFTPPVFTYSWSPSTFIAGQENLPNPIATGVTATTTYTVTIASSEGCSTTASTTVTVQSGASITTQPVATSACQGGSATFSVVANGPGLTYQWYNDSGELTGSTSATLTLTNLTTADAQPYYVIITPTCGSPITSNSANLTVNPTPTATAPSNQTYCAGATAAITLNGTPSGVTFDISGGASIGLANQTGVTAIPSFTATAGSATISITPKANGCTGTAVTYSIVVNALPATPTLGSNSPVCAGSTLNLTASTVPAPGYGMNSNSGVAFVDISTSGTDVTGAVSDDSEHQLTIPPFTYNGVSYTTARVGNNGVLVFGATANDINYTNVALPAPLGINTTGLMTNVTGSALTAICAYWDDLTTSTSVTTSIKTQTIGGKYIVQWTNEDSFSATGNGTITFQIQLDLSNGKIHLVYPDVVFGAAGYDNGASATVGLNYSATSALQYSYLTSSLVNGQSITFTPSSAIYSWTGPNGFSSSLQNPTISNVSSAAAGTYTVVVTNPATGCTSVPATQTVVVTSPTTYYADTDGDTYGNLAVTTTSCTGAPTGYVANSTDCDDTNATKYQSALLYVDADGDGYDAGQTTVCYGAAVPAGYSATTLGTDCNDNNASLTTNCTAASSIVNLKMFVEGYYIGGNTMNSVALNQDYVSDAANVEMMTVELHDATTHALVVSTTGMLHINGTLSASFATAPSGSYYIAVIGRNMVQTWSANPQTIGATPLSYDFSASASQAYGDNMVEVQAGVFAMYSGDINQDTVVDGSDSTDLLNDIENANFGVLATDLNGDGVVDNSDTTVFLNNAENAIYSVQP